MDQRKTNMSELYIKLPFPPTLNTYHRHIVIQGKPRTILSKQGREYKQSVLNAVLFDDGDHPPMMGRLHVTIAVAPPDNRRRDLDNIPKSVLDSLTEAKIWGDDEQIDQLLIIRLPVEKPGYAMVTISEQ
jgi:crossover junction endodeoxyribonuclease RusA